jgi:hypothetical protein
VLLHLGASRRILWIFGLFPRLESSSALFNQQDGHSTSIKIFPCSIYFFWWWLLVNSCIVTGVTVEDDRFVCQCVLCWCWTLSVCARKWRCW